VRALIGVVGLDNEITLKARPTTAGVASRIEDALKRQAEREAKRVQVEVDGSAVTLRGNVHSWQERDAASWAAWAAPGVTSVVNEVRVGG
jgi:osmotically-inducible protein OsmY